ncbi:MAG: hypothetical protein JXL81_07040, partial [Deltaproteobacteria bacterium]|nr:hypothetical protein [Deltaproteobacteria bacterium]
MTDPENLVNIFIAIIRQPTTYLLDNASTGSSTEALFAGITPKTRPADRAIPTAADNPHKDTGRGNPGTSCLNTHIAIKAIITPIKAP